MRSITATLLAANALSGMAAEPVVILVNSGTATAADDGKSATYSFIKDPEKIRSFERSPTGWQAGFGLMIDHKRGLRHSGLARSFPVMAGCYTRSIHGKDPVSAATLICAFSQSAALFKSR